MRCAWCDGPADAEYVDIGIGYQQVTPLQCGDCGATQMRGTHEERRHASLEELRRGWWMGPDTEDAMVHYVANDDWCNAREWWHRLAGWTPGDLLQYAGQRDLHITDLRQVTHMASVNFTRDGQIHAITQCGLMLSVGFGQAPAVTCLACLIRS